MLGGTYKILRMWKETIFTINACGEYIKIFRNSGDNPIKEMKFILDKQTAFAR